MRTSKNPTFKKRTGSHYTPEVLAKFVAERILHNTAGLNLQSLTVLDPACGDGELLLAFARCLTEQQLHTTTFIGIESNGDELELAHKKLQEVGIQPPRLYKDDFLQMWRSKNDQPTLFADSHLGNSKIDPVDIIIANPPYVRTQVLGGRVSRELAQSFGLSGRVDLYHAFLIAMTHYLNQSGIIGVITSNRYLTTQSGKIVREFINKEYDILELFDLGDTKLFEAAVLPAILIGQRKCRDLKTKPQARFTRIYEELNSTPTETVVESDSVLSAIDTGHGGIYSVNGHTYAITTGILSLPESSDEPWRLVTDKESAWVSQIEKSAFCRIGDIAKVRVGIKTTADEVFIRETWDSVSEDCRPETVLLHPILTHDDAATWQSGADLNKLKKILYPHKVIDGRRCPIDLKEFPRARKYLESHRKRLESRKYVIEANRQWFEIWVPQDPSAWKKVKVVFPDISEIPQFFLDRRGCLVDGSCYWIVQDERVDEPLLYIILGVANSSLMTRYHDLVFNNKLYAGRRRYLTQYVEKYPLPDPASKDGKDIIALVKRMVAASAHFDPTNLSDQLNRLVSHAFGVTSFE